jgi:hypothetical protein
MSKSPLSGAFAESSATTKKKNKKNGAILLIAGIALTSSIGGVFAANSITINGGAAIEFGQGSAATATCDQNLFTSMTQNYTTNDVFRVATVTVGRIDDAACSATTLRVNLLDETGASIDSFEILGDAETKDTDRSGIANPIDASTVDRIAITTEN